MISTRFEKYSTIWVDHSKSRGSMSVFWRMNSIIGGVNGLKELFKRKRCLLIPSPIFKIAILWSQICGTNPLHPPWFLTAVYIDVYIWDDMMCNSSPLTNPLIPHTHGDIILWYMHIYRYMCIICVCIICGSKRRSIHCYKTMVSCRKCTSNQSIDRDPGRAVGWLGRGAQARDLGENVGCRWFLGSWVRAFFHPEEGWTFSECYPLVN